MYRMLMALAASVLILALAACTPEEQEIVEEYAENVAEAPHQALRLESEKVLSAVDMAIQQYIMDSPREGAPQVENIEELGRMLKDYEYLSENFKLVDGWGNPLVYHREGRIKYTLTSLGADGKEGGEGFAADIVRKDGVLLP